MVRNRQVHDDLRFVSVRTFDSFATRILLAADTERDLKGFGYDARIELAIEALENPESDASLIVSRCRHLIVDEIQDLVGVRGRLVQILNPREFLADLPCWRSCPGDLRLFRKEYGQDIYD